MARWTAQDVPKQAGRTAIITGANSGLGLETAAGLAAAGATVVLACRDPGRAVHAVAELKKRAPQGRFDMMSLDLADLASIRSFAEAVGRAHRRVDLLINNAGVMALPLSRTKDGFEMQFGTNHLGHFALTGLLLERLQAAREPRVVTVASMAHRWTRAMNLDDPNFKNAKYDKWDAYGKSKLANLLFTFELSRRLQAANIGVSAVAAHPGYSATNLGFAGPAMEGSRLKAMVMSLGNVLFAQNAAMGALPSLYAATMPDVQSGDYIGPDGLREMRGYPKKVGCRAAARDEASARKLWAISEQLTGVSYP